MLMSQVLKGLLTACIYISRLMQTHACHMQARMIEARCCAEGRADARNDATRII